MAFDFPSMSGFNSAFGIVGMFMVVIFVFSFAMMAVVFTKILRQRKKDDKSPKLTVDAKVVTKRTHVSGGHGDHSAHTAYYTTFQVESGDRMELQVSSFEYGMLVEGDYGKLTFQGSRFLNFARG